MTPDLRVELLTQKDVLVLAMKGDVTAAASEALLSHFEPEKKWTRKKYVLDFSGVEYITSAGIAIIIQILSRGKRQNASIVCCGLVPHFQKIFQMVGLMKYTSHFDHRDLALKHFESA